VFSGIAGFMSKKAVSRRNRNVVVLLDALVHMLQLVQGVQLVATCLGNRSP
jgi:hypothetical protein